MSKKNPKPVEPDCPNVAASLIPWTEPPLELREHRWYGPPGAFLQSEQMDGSHWILCCPNCGAVGSNKDDVHWNVVSGNFQDVTTLTLDPSIRIGCCGWHGYLKNGVFKTCKKLKEERNKQ